jgi:CSLREA domain-containing protein
MHVGWFSLALPSLPIRRLLGSSLVVIIAMFSITPAPLAQIQDAPIIVDTTKDGLNDGRGDCSLREAIQAANTDSPVDGCPAGHGDDVILLPAGNYVLTLAGADEDANTTGDLDITAGSLILIGPGPERTVIDGNHLDRVLHVHNGATVQIYGIRIMQGTTPSGESSAGGGIYNAGTLLLSSSTVISNTTASGDVPLANGGHGGGVYNLGTLTLDHAWVIANVTGNGGGASPFLGSPNGGRGGYGGGVYNNGSLTLLGSTVGDNRTGRGGDGGAGGSGGLGGGICNSGTLTLTDSTIDSNQTGGGGSGSWAGGRGGLGGGIYSSSTVTISNSVIIRNGCGGGGWGNRSNGAGGRGGYGGGIYNDGTMVVTHSAVLGNISGQGGGGDGVGSGGGAGGGIYNGGALVLSNSSIGDNATGDGAYSWWGNNLNSGGAGGGIYNSGLLELSKSTISSNTTGSGGEAHSDSGGDGGHGGGIHNSGVLTVTDCTVSGNTTGDGGNGEQATSGYGGGVYNSQTLTLRNSTVSYNTAGSVTGDGIGGGIYTQGVLTVTSTILAENVDMSGPCDCYQQESVLQSLGYNLVESEGTCVFTTTGDLTGIAPSLGPLGDYGGNTFTHPLLIGSPAIDQGSCRGSTTDQRGFPRPIDCTYIPNADDGCDIGAFEAPCAFGVWLPWIERPISER